MADSDSLLELRGITKRFSGVVALQDVNLTLRKGQILALVGENGAGKSTLMKVLSGAHSPDEGTICLDGQEVSWSGTQAAQVAGISIIYQEFSLVPSLTVVENLFLGRERVNRIGACARREMEQQARAVLERLGATISLSARISELSIAEQQFVEIAKAMLRQTRVLIMDEPTATLTPEAVARLFGVMRDLVQQGVSIIFISHHLDEVFEIADDILCLRDGRCVGQRPVSSCSHEELIRMMVGRDVTQVFPSKPSQPPGRVLLEVRRLQRKTHLPEISFEVREGEILGIAGLVGAGRTKMVRALIGADRAHRKEILLEGKPIKISDPADALTAGIGLAPEDRKQQGLVIGAAVQENILFTVLHRLCHPIWRFVRRSASNAVASEQIKNLRVKAPSAQQPVNTLSGGNQQKVVLAKWLAAQCRILILDEPTRGIDVGAKSEIYELMRELTRRGVAIIMISSDLPEVIGMSDRVMVMRMQRIAHFFTGDEPLTAEGIMAFAAGGRHG
jgi:ribose transport system ATP-binding protein